MPRVEVRIVGVSTKRGSTQTKLDTVTDEGEIVNIVNAELAKWSDVWSMGVNPISIKVHIEGGRTMDLKASVSVVTELDQSSKTKLSSLPKRKTKSRPFKIKFGDHAHDTLCRARFIALHENNMQVSRLKIEGYLTDENKVTRAGHAVLDTFEARPIKEIEKWVCRQLLYITKNGTVERFAQDYLDKHGMTKSIQKHSWEPSKLGVGSKGVRWLEENVVRLSVKEHILVYEALKYYPRESLAEPLSNDQEWIRAAARMRVAALDKLELEKEDLL